MTSLTPTEALTKRCYLCELDLPREAWSPSAWATPGTKCRECNARYLRAYARGEALPLAREGRRARRRERGDQAPDGTRWCPRCDLHKPEDTFTGKGGYCRECRAKYNAEWQSKKPDYMREWRARRRVTHECLTDGCKRLTRHDVCRSHRPTVERPPRRTGARNEYTAVHNRLRKVCGPAKLLACVECGGPAEQWSYDHLDPDERTGENSRGRTVRYSTSLDHYRPLCVPCHRTADGILLWGERPSVHANAPVAPSIEFEPGTIEPPRLASYVDLCKPPELTGRRRRCSICKMTKDEGAFYWRGRERKCRASRCRNCDRIYQAKRNGSKHRGSLPGKVGSPERYRYHRERAIVIYGGRCVWCGAVDELEFDHPDNDGAAHRRVQSTSAMLTWISAHERPLDDWRLQLLCKSCHRGPKWHKRREEGRPA